MDFELKMNVLLISQIIVLFLCYCATNVNGRPRLKRQSQYRFNVIANSSFPCDQVTTSSTTTTTASTALESDGLYSSKPLSLSSEDLDILLTSKRISPDSMLAARTLEDTDTFPNLLPLSSAYTDNVRQKLQNKATGILTKAEIIQYLIYLDSVAEQTTGPEGMEKIPGLLFASENEAHVIGKRDTSSGANTMEYCMYRGEPTSDPQYIRMCTTCAITTDLGSNYYPRYVNEAVCKADDGYCLVVNVGTAPQTNHGKCQPITLPLNVLQKKDGYCVVAIKDDQTLIVEEWEPKTESIHVGCECTVDVNSIFRYFV